MKYFIVYHYITGEILRTGSCPESMVFLQALKLNEKVIEGEADDLKEKVVNGQVILKTFEDHYVQEEEEVDELDSKSILISNKMKTLLRDTAIAELKKEGKIE